jgi:redox-sensing transcriptional repressor
MAEDGATTTSSETLAEAAGVNSAKVRKDLSYLGSYGTRGVGYDVAYLIHQVRRETLASQYYPA